MVAVRCLTDNSRALFPRPLARKEVPREAQVRTLLFLCQSGGLMRPLARKDPEGGAGTGKDMGGKAVRKRSFDTCLCRVVFPGTSHMRDRRTTDNSVIVHGLAKIMTTLFKRPSPAEKEFRMVGLCTKQRHTQTRRARCVLEN